MINDRIYSWILLVSNRYGRLSSEQVVWDIEDLSKQPPWGNKISPDITDLSSYFVTSDGEDFIGVLERALKTAAEEGDALKIESL